MLEKLNNVFQLVNFNEVFGKHFLTLLPYFTNYDNNFLTLLPLFTNYDNNFEIMT